MRQGTLGSWLPGLRRRTIVMVPLLVALLAFVSVGCSGSSNSDTPSSSAASGCAEAAALKESLTALTNVDPVNDGLDALKSAATNVKTELDATVSAVSSELQPAVDQVKMAFDDLETTLNGISSAGGLGAAATEDRHIPLAVGHRADRLVDEITEDC